MKTLLALIEAGFQAFWPQLCMKSRACPAEPQEKKVWTDLNKETKEVGLGEDDKKETTETAAPASGAPGKYVPPSLRGASEKGGKGKGKGGDYQGQQDATLRAAWSAFLHRSSQMAMSQGGLSS